ncbi:hypothetical protein [Noviherbaspirillum sedimenti]|uniref:Lipoprotein n=1 Tax=Noviherbaspirillum sedimenti TaxID=2320865 RepID=A0A3A3FXW8_9BURK|nr:hypothetical protein [Noviherbaspirillum sedimenti]RJG00461.1 hypothetical protein D3878_01765 [Noviherbaspirillum sedimenti]
MRYLILALPLALAACASMDAGEKKGITIETTSRQQVVAGASCVVSNGNGSWQVVTPATVDTGGVNGDLRVVCNKSGYRTSEFLFRPSAYASSGTSLGIGVGGGGRRVGGGVGFSLPLGGNGGGGSYPSQVAVEMSPM